MFTPVLAERLRTKPCSRFKNLRMLIVTAFEGKYFWQLQPLVTPDYVHECLGESLIRRDSISKVSLSTLIYHYCHSSFTVFK